MAERGFPAVHVTICRSRTALSPVLSDDCANASRQPTTLSRLNETYVRVKSKRVYLYRAVDSAWSTLDSLLNWRPTTGTFASTTNLEHVPASGLKTED